MVAKPMITDPLFHNLSPMNLGIVILDYGHGIHLPKKNKNKKLHTASIRVKIIVAKHIKCQKQSLQ